MGDLFSQIAVREKFAANEAFTIFADAHRNYHRAGTEFQKKAAPVCRLLTTGDGTFYLSSFLTVQIC